MTPFTKNSHLSLATLLIASATLAACSSSDSDSSAPANDQPGSVDAVLPAMNDDAVSNAGDSDGGSTDGEVVDATETDMPDVVSGISSGLSGQALNLGFVQIDQNPDDSDGGSVFGSFVRANLPVPAGQLVSAIIPPLDTCSISRGDDLDSDVPDMGDFDPDITFIDAGDSLVLSSPAGTWLTLLRQEQFGLILYAPENDELPLPVPTNLVLDVPGAEFPAFSNISVPDVTPLTGVVTEGSNTFRWNAGSGDPSVFINIELFSFSVGSDPVTVDCFASDDGEFILPAEVQAELGSDFSPFLTLSRIGTNAVQLNDSVLLVSNTNEADL